jgi:HAD superfamily phosphatase (TIGR01668 family)
MLCWIAPHLRVESVCQLTAERLRALEIDALLLDVDCTLKRYSESQIGPEVRAWLEGLRAARIGLCLVSNGMGRRIRRLADELSLPFVAKALKPLPLGCRRAVRQMGFDARRTAMVGDQLFADVMAGRLAGLKAILVRPIHPEEEPWFTRLKRGPECFLLARLGVLEDQAGAPQVQS